MAGAIRGITVEIGGNTTKLDKALEGVNKRSRSLSSELTQVNKLLKLDPGNTDLLAQKQKILADAITETKDKLNTLKSAEAQVQEQFKRGEVSEAQVRALQREIIETTQKLGKYEQAAAETTQALKKLGKGSGDAADGTDDVDKGADEASDALDEFSDKADKAGKSGEGLGSKLAGAAKAGLAALAAGVTATVGTLVGSAEATREYRTEMGKLEAAFTSNDHSAKTASATFKSLQGIIGETDQSVEAAQQIALLADSEENAAKWADQAAGVVGKFGDALQPETFFESANETIKLGEATGAYTQMLEGCGLSVEDFNKGLAACKTEAEKQAYMLQVTESALGAAGEAYRKNNEEIIRANEANNTWAETMAQVGASVEPILTDIKLLGSSLLSDLLPGIKQITEAFRGILNGDAGAAENLGAALSGIFSDVLSKLTELAPTVVSVGMSLITNLATSIISMLPSLVETGSKILVSVLDGLISAAPLIFSAIGQMIADMGPVLEAAIPQIISLAVSLVNTILGQLGTIIEPLISALPGIIMSLCNAIVENFPILLQGILSAVMMLLQYTPQIVSSILPLIPQIITAVCDMIAENAPLLLNTILELVWMIVTEVLPQVLVAIAQAIPSILGSIVSGLGKIFASIAGWFGDLISKIGSWLGNILQSVGVWVSNMISKAREMGSNFLRNIVSFVQQLPGKIWTFLQNAVSKIASFGSTAASKARAAAKGIFDGVVNGIKGLPSKVLSIGSDLVKGLWNGINNMTSWVIGKIQKFGDNVLSGIKKFFGIASPSRLMRDEVGKYVAQGIAVGVSDNADEPIDAVKALGEEMANEQIDLNGATINRKLATTFTTNAVGAGNNAELLNKLDSIYERLNRLQIVLDTGTLVGETIDKIDAGLAGKQLLSARGV